VRHVGKGARYISARWQSSYELPSRFSDFYAWVESKHSAYLNFKSRMDVRYMVQMWFDNEFRQSRTR
jgi:hypothetical protein